MWKLQLLFVALGLAATSSGEEAAATRDIKLSNEDTRSGPADDAVVVDGAEPQTRFFTNNPELNAGIGGFVLGGGVALLAGELLKNKGGNNCGYGRRRRDAEDPQTRFFLGNHNNNNNCNCRYKRDDSSPQTRFFGGLGGGGGGGSNYCPPSYASNYGYQGQQGGYPPPGSSYGYPSYPPPPSSGYGYPSSYPPPSGGYGYPNQGYRAPAATSYPPPPNAGYGSSNYGGNSYSPSNAGYGSSNNGGSSYSPPRAVETYKPNYNNNNNNYNNNYNNNNYNTPQYQESYDSRPIYNGNGRAAGGGSHGKFTSQPSGGLGFGQRSALPAAEDSSSVKAEEVKVESAQHSDNVRFGDK